MPYKHVNSPIPEEFDKRVKLTALDKADILELSVTTSTRKLALMYGVSRRLIQFTVDPAKQEQNLLRRKERGNSKCYYNREANTIAVRKSRQHKQALIKAGIIKEGVIKSQSIP